MTIMPRKKGLGAERCRPRSALCVDVYLKFTNPKIGIHHVCQCTTWLEKYAHKPPLRTVGISRQRWQVATPN